MKPLTRIPNANAKPGQPQRGRPGIAATNPSSAQTINPSRTAAPPAQLKSHSYSLQAPIPLAGRSQQIRATIGGSAQVAGSVDISASTGGKMFISNLHVGQEHRRRGVAAKLIDAAVSAARRRGFSSARLEARPSDNAISSQALVAMYRRQGFKSVGKSHRGSPLMERKL